MPNTTELTLEQVEDAFDVALKATVPAGAWLTTYSEIETMRTVAGPHPHSVWEPETTRVELIRDSNQAPWRYEGPAAVVIGELAEEVEPTIVETPDGRARLADPAPIRGQSRYAAFAVSYSRFFFSSMNFISNSIGLT